MMAPQEIIHFWFEELSPVDHFKKNAELDQNMRKRFSSLVQSAFQSELFSWRRSAEGRLAEIIVLDQIPRNIYRETSESFSGDRMALALAQEAIANGSDLMLSIDKRAFLYIPYMHSESLMIHDVALKLFSQHGLEENLAFEQKHRKILERFGRYPHRNQILGRSSTPAETEFLKQPGSSF